MPSPRTSYGPAGGYSIFTTLVAGFMYVFGFVVAAVVGFRTVGRPTSPRGCSVTWSSQAAPGSLCTSRRIPAGLAIVIAMVAVGYTIVCAVCVFAAPAQLNYDGVNVPVGLSQPAFDSWAASHADEVICNFNFHGGPGLKTPPPPNVTCGGQSIGPPPGTVYTAEGRGYRHRPRRRVTGPDQGLRGHGGQPGLRADYHSQFLVPSTTLMFQVGLWIAVEATIGFMVGLGLSLVMGQRTVAVILLIVLGSRPVLLTSAGTSFRTWSTCSGASSAWPWPTSNRGVCRHPSAEAGM